MTDKKPNRLRVTDDDNGEIIVAYDDKEVRGWFYTNETEQRMKMMQAREYVEGWYDGFKVAIERLEEILGDTAKDFFPPKPTQ